MSTDTCCQELLEQKFNVTVTEPVVDEKERLKHVSKEEIIEQYLRIKVSLSFTAWKSIN